MRMPRIAPRTFIWIAAALLGVAALAWAFWPRPVQVEVAAVTQGRFEQSIEEDGRTRLKERYVVSSPVAARMARSTLHEGDAVAAGDVVAVLSPVMSSMIDDRTAREAAARLRAATAGVERATARLERARLAQREARLELERDERLAREGFVAAARLDTARLNHLAAERELQAGQAERDMALQERAQAAAALAPAQAGTGDRRPMAVRSPVRGVVLRVAAQSESTVAAGTALVEIGDPAQMEVVAELLTTDAVQAQPGTRVVVERWGGPPVEARVHRIEPAAFTKVSALGIEEQRVRVLIDPIDPPPAWRLLGDGFRVTARVVTVSADAAVQVSVGALFPATGGFAVYRLDGGHAWLQPVELGGRNASSAWVRRGLEPGQRVILYPPAAVVDGGRVQVRDPAAAER